MDSNFGVVVPSYSLPAPFAVIDGELCARCDVLACDDEHVWPTLVLHVQPAGVPALDAFASRGQSVRAKELRDA
jgi:hypothetical protein